MNKNDFAEIVRWKAEKMATKVSWRKQAKELGCEWEAFKIGGWDAMIFDGARFLGLSGFSAPQFRKKLIEEWLGEGLGE